jgi:hypothetical protein
MKKNPYSPWKRKPDSGRTIYYVLFMLDEVGLGTAKCPGMAMKTEPEVWAISCLAGWQVPTRENVRFRDFAKDFYAWYGACISSLRIRGRQFGRSHSSNIQALLGNCFVPAFGGHKLLRIDSDRAERGKGATG